MPPRSLTESAQHPYEQPDGPEGPNGSGRWPATHYDGDWAEEDSGGESPLTVSFPLYTVEELRQLPPRQWLVDGVLMESSVALLSGSFASCKSIVALAIACSVASGTPWLGLEVMPGPVLYVAADDPADEVAKRASGWEAAHGACVQGLLVFPGAFQLAAKGAAQQLIAAVKRRLGASGPRLIVFDTFSKCFEGLDENSAKDTAVFFKAAELLRDHFKTTILIVHHVGHKGTNVRGSSNIGAAVETMLSATLSGKDVTLRCTKQKGSPPFAAIKARVRPSGDTLVLEKTESGSCAGCEPVLAALGDHNFTNSEWEAAVERSGSGGFYKHKLHLTDGCRVTRNGTSRAKGTTYSMTPPSPVSLQDGGQDSSHSLTTPPPIGGSVSEK